MVYPQSVTEFQLKETPVVSLHRIRNLSCNSTSSASGIMSDTVRRLLSPSIRPPCRQAPLESRCVSSQSLALRRASVALSAGTRSHRRDELRLSAGLHSVPSHSPR